VAEGDPQVGWSRKQISPAPPDITGTESVPAPLAVTADQPLLRVQHRGLLLTAVMLVAICQFLDATIANVALPHMQAALGASSDSISWVLTSFIIAGAIGMPITGWLSDRLGSRNLFIGSTVLFLVASAACGAANSLAAMVVISSIQGLAAAFIGPMTQTIMFDISPPSKQAQTMATFGMIVMVAPISGPFLGGYLTDYLSWRWIYYVNLPIGIPALVMLWWLLPSRPLQNRRLDLFGFSALALGLGALQLMLDRGQNNDWFASWETVIEAGVTVSAIWVFLVHSHFSKKPLFASALVRDPSFLAGCAFMLVMGVTNIALSAVLPTMYQTIYRYPVIFTGILMAPRGIGVMATSQFTSRMMRVIDYRYMITIGYSITAGSMWIMTTWSPDMDWHRIVFASLVQGLGLGMVFAPMTLIAFSGIKPELRPDGSSLIALFRNLGGSVGISIIMTVMARNQQVSHADLTAHVTAMSMPYFDMSGVGADGGAGTSPAMINATINRQSQMVAYIDNFYMIAWLLLAIAPLALLLKKPKRVEDLDPMHME
jgi:DHA2 family multidrug resistance protein